MIRYNIKMNSNGEFYIVEKINGIEEEYYEYDFLNLLRKFDKIKTARFRVNKYGKASIISKDFNITIENFDNFVKSRYKIYMPKLWKKVSAKLKKVQSDKYKGNTVTIGISGKKIAAIGTIAFISLYSSTNMIDSLNNKEEKEVVSILPEDANTSIDEKINTLYEEFDNAEIETETIENSNDDKVIVDIEYESTNEINREKNYNYICEKYGDIVREKSEKWGISSNLIFSLMSFESGGKDPNLCQIEFNSWEDYIITCYNFNNNKYESVVLTNNPSKYANMDIQTINEQEYLNPKTNISVACMILRYSYEHMNNHIIAGIQGYNYGVQAMDEVLEDTEIEYNMSRDEILSDQNNTIFLNNRFKGNIRNGESYGDNIYVEHVFQYLEGDEPSITFKNVDEYGNITDNTIYINNNNLNENIVDSINIARN